MRLRVLAQRSGGAPPGPHIHEAAVGPLSLCISICIWTRLL